MIKAKRLAYARLVTRDLDRQADYWSHVMGLAIVARERDRVFLATRVGEECVVLERGEAAGGLGGIAFVVDPASDLAEIQTSLTARGIASTRRSDPTPHVGDALVFKDPKGTDVEIFTGVGFADDDGLECGIKPVKFGHMAFKVKDVQTITDFYCEVLGFRVSDWVGSHFSFLRCGPNHHTINFAHAPAEGIHHLAFEVRDRSELSAACDYLTARKIQLVWGPLRHVVGHNLAAYHQNPDDIRVEVFTELDQMSDESLGYWEPRPWHEERPLRPKTWPADTWRSQWGFGTFGSFPGYPPR